ncbi:MAG: hypothetical protein KJZ87_26975 [Thermoguttaceae bacterium]|nr:hypothetical protein [Thermoguttaceae bacterium]
MAYAAPSFPAQSWDGSTANPEREEGVAAIRDPNSQDRDRISAEVMAVERELRNPSSGNGAAAGTGVVAVEGPAYGVLRRTVLTLTNVAVAMTDADLAGCHGSLKVYDFPAGVIQILGCVQDLTLAAGDGGIADSAAVVGSMGTAAAGVDNETLIGTEADVVASTPATLTAGAGTLKGKTAAAQMAAGVFDGTSTAVDLHLNFAVPAADSTGDDTLSVNGTIVLTWINHGDN